MANTETKSIIIIYLITSSWLLKKSNDIYLFQFFYILFNEILVYIGKNIINKLTHDLGSISILSIVTTFLSLLLGPFSLSKNFILLI